ncbi:MAG: amidohydrolase, partial [Chloroflexi bacterium]
PNPFLGLYSLVARKNHLGQTIGPQEAISRDEALWSYTAAGTWLTREEGLKGTLEAGKLADVAVLDRDYFEVLEHEIAEIQVQATIVGGRVAWERGGSEGAREPGD